MTAARNNERIKREEENAKDQLNTLKKQICQSLQDFETAVSFLFKIFLVKLI